MTTIEKEKIEMLLLGVKAGEKLPQPGKIYQATENQEIGVTKIIELDIKEILSMYWSIAPHWESVLKIHVKAVRKTEK